MTILAKSVMENSDIYGKYFQRNGWKNLTDLGKIGNWKIFTELEVASKSVKKCQGALHRFNVLKRGIY